MYLQYGLVKANQILIKKLFHYRQRVMRKSGT